MTVAPFASGERPVPARRILQVLDRVWRRPGELAITICVFLVAALALVPFYRWAIADAVFHGDARACEADGAGACWAFLGEKLRFILFGFYPPEEHWRPALAVAALALLFVLSALPRFWSGRLLVVWAVTLPGLALLLKGGFGLLRPVATNDWGGLPLTLLVSTAGMAFAFPLALTMALARQSDMRILKALAIAYIETLRAVPMIVVLYVAMLIAPMALPSGLLVDKLLRAQIGVTIFASAYLAEVIRAGLVTIPRGQYDAGAALGLSSWRIQRLIVLPQALRVVIPAIVNLAIGLLLNTSLLAVIGIHDLLNTARASAADPNWLGYYTEAYLFVAVLYFGISHGVSRYSLWLERRLARQPG